jgi:hypothetical protein
MKFSEETLMAYVDGEADAAQRAAIEQALAQDPQLAERIARERRLRSQLAAAFGGVIDEPVPARLTERAHNAPAGGKILAGSPRWLGAVRHRTQLWSWPEWGALAASLLIGVLISRPWLSAPGTPGVQLATVDGKVLAQGALASNLSVSSGGSVDPRSQISLGVSYLAKSGNYCRTFGLPGSNPMAGIACREGAQWRVQALLPTSREGTSSEPQYRQAGSPLPPAVLEIVEAESTAELDAEEETAVRARGWQR